MKNLRYLQHNFRARIENNLVLTRIGELSLRVLNILTRGLIYNLSSSIKAVFIEGLETSHSSGFDIDIAIPAVVVQNVGDGINTPDVSLVADENLPNSGADFQVTVTTPDPSLDRIDIIEGQVKKRSEFTDTAVDVVDPITKVVTPTTLDRDFEIYLDVQVKTGTPGASPVPPNSTSATAGFLLGTITTDVLDLSTQYLIKIAVGADSEFIEIDMRGAVPSSTTRAERMAAINAAGFGTIATNDGGAIRLTSFGIGENSMLKIKSPIQSSKDAYTLVFGVSTTLGYLDTYIGTNEWFKISEVFVPQGAATLVPASVRSREDKDTLWDADANTVENGFSLDGHRKSDPLDHLDGSVKVNHIDPSVLAAIQEKVTLYRDPGVPIYNIAGDSTFRKGGLFFEEDIEVVQVNGGAQDAIEIEQEFPVNRVDQRQDDTTGTGYAVPTVLSEAVADKHLFTVGVLINDGSQYYQVTEFEDNHSRVGVYITNGGSIAGFTHMRITLHNNMDSSLGFVDVPIADLQTVSVGYIYADLVAPGLVNGLTYHYHLSLVGAGAVTTAILANDTLGNLTYREMYLPTGAKYGSVDKEDVVNVLGQAGSDLIPTRLSGDDDISSPGDGFIGVSGLDIMVEDFSDNGYWANWNYQGYVGVDMLLGKLKFPSGQSVRFLFAEFNTQEGINDQDAKNYIRHTSNESVDTSLVNLEDGWTEFEINEILPDVLTTVFESLLGISEVVVFPENGTPKGTFSFLARGDGAYHAKPLLFRLRYAMDTSDTGVVKLDFKIYVKGILVTTRSITINTPNDTSRATILTTTSDAYVAEDEFVRGDEIDIELSRDNGVGSNHTGKFQLIGMTLI